MNVTLMFSNGCISVTERLFVECLASVSVCVCVCVCPVCVCVPCVCVCVCVLCVCVCVCVCVWGVSLCASSLRSLLV